MRVFDFDNTIYDGESVQDFITYCIKQKPKLLKYMPAVLNAAAKYKAGKTTIEDIEEFAAEYTGIMLKEFPDVRRVASKFWDKNMSKIKSWYKPQEDDVILTASFNIIVEEACRRLGIKTVLCSVFNEEKGEVEYINFGKCKKERFQKEFGKDAVIDEFYTDLEYDEPMFEISKAAFMVNGNEIKQVK